jgi:ATP-dependent exoDNAse (exonuclease V) beta subunit
LRNEFGIEPGDAAALKPRIETTRAMMRDLTAGQHDLRPELPFVLLDGDRLIDGTIDLLCRSDDQIALFDYKFTEADVESVLETYRGQMEIYCRAARRAFPESGDLQASLVVISAEETRLVQVRVL